MLRSSVTNRLRLTGHTEVEALVPGRTTVLGRRTVNARCLEQGALHWIDVSISLDDHPGIPADGSLDTAMLRDFFIDLDFPKRRMRLGPTLPALPKGGAEPPVVRARGLPLVPGGINQRLRGWFLVDAGGELNFFEMRSLPARARSGVFDYRGHGLYVMPTSDECELDPDVEQEPESGLFPFESRRLGSPSETGFEQRRLAHSSSDGVFGRDNRPQRSAS